MTKTFLNSDREMRLLNHGYDFVVGVDEVGRGAWAGPLYLCAYAFNHKSTVIEGINDSKRLTKQSREACYSKLKTDKYFLKILDNKHIDKLGLGKAMRSGLSELLAAVEIELGSNVLFIVDGYFKGIWGKNVRFETKADSNYYSVACASIVAKVMRDNLMRDLATKYPPYSFDANVGYGTANHIEAIRRYGITEIHRISYKPIQKELIKD